MLQKETAPEKRPSTGLETPPVLFLLFNRPDLTRRVFERIRQARPSRLFVAADGPRAERPAERLLCDEARAVIDLVDWDCEVATLYRTENLGCKRAVSSAISWFFEHVGEGVILEDDCLPDPTFLPFCAELLERYRDDERVMQICGITATGRWKSDVQSYLFSLYGGIWGWASWRRAWRQYDVTMHGWRKPGTRRQVRRIIGDANQFHARAAMFDAGLSGMVDTWDYQWSFARIRRGGLSVVPSVNLISNIGFREDGTHTLDESSSLANKSTDSLAWPIRHPAAVERDVYYDRAYSQLHGHIRKRVPFHRRIVRGVRRLVKYRRARPVALQ